MSPTLKLKSLYIDMPSWATPVNADDFLVAIGKRKSNSVYHIYSVSKRPRKNTRVVRYNLKVMDSDLITALRRDPEQSLIPIVWYSRDKKK